MNTIDIHNLERFLSAQSVDYDVALEELRSGAKKSHWMWYIFPQAAGLGSSSMAARYAIKTKEEAFAYLQHKVLGNRLTECAAALLRVEGKSIEEIIGFPVNLKTQIIDDSVCGHFGERQCFLSSS